MSFSIIFDTEQRLTLSLSSWIIANRKNPGCIPINSDSYYQAIKQIPYFDKWKKRSCNAILSRLCHSCRCLRPLRAKHCRVCNRCVQVSFFKSFLVQFIKVFSAVIRPPLSVHLQLRWTQESRLVLPVCDVNCDQLFLHDLFCVLLCHD